LLVELRRGFKQAGLDLKIKSQIKKFLGTEEFYVNAYYDPEDDQNRETPIEVIIYHNFDKDVIWTNKQITELLVQVFDATVHEYKHQRQSRKRNYAEFWERADADHEFHEYLQDPDELDAYALSIAIELCRTVGKFRALRYMPKFTTLARLKVQEQYVSPNLNAYVSHFEKPISPLLRRLAKKIYVRLMKVDTDHIFM
jgi:predicted HicB family RNase H-like nuclease